MALLRKLGGGAITDRLDADLTKYPPPEPTIPGRARGYWSKSSVFDILHNPKYTGYRIFNRRATRAPRGTYNDPRKWVRSHEPLIPKPNAPTSTAGVCSAPAATEGKVPATTAATTTAATQAKTTANAPDITREHPRTIHIREDELTEAILAIYTERLDRTLIEIKARQHRIRRQAQIGDPDDPFTRDLREDCNQLENEKNTTLLELAELDAAQQSPQKSQPKKTRRSSTPCPISSPTSATPPKNYCSNSSTSHNSVSSFTTTPRKPPSPSPCLKTTPLPSAAP